MITVHADILLRLIKYELYGSEEFSETESSALSDRLSSYIILTID